MEYEEWEATFKPMKNPNTPTHEEETIMFETYGADLDVVLKTKSESPKKIWTLVEGDTGAWILSGYRLVNRINYLITENPFSDRDCVVLYQEYNLCEPPQQSTNI